MGKKPCVQMEGEKKEKKEKKDEKMKEWKKRVVPPSPLFISSNTLYCFLTMILVF